MGCILILKTGERITVDDMTVTTAKHIRRTNSAIPLRKGDGRKMLIPGNRIQTILPLSK